MPKLDASLGTSLEKPSSDFQVFLHDYFLTPMIFMRREQDAQVLHRLAGHEKEIAEKMIEANLPTGYEHLIEAAASLQMPQAVPILQAMLREAKELSLRLTLSKALLRYGLLQESDLTPLLRQGVQSSGDFLCGDIFPFALLHQPHAVIADLIRIGLRREHYSVRCTAYNALVDLETISKEGATLTKDTVRRAFLSRFQRHLYPEYQRYIGDDVYNRKPDFAQRLNELDARLNTLIGSEGVFGR